MKMKQTLFFITFTCLIILGCNQPENINSSSSDIKSSSTQIAEDSIQQPETNNSLSNEVLHKYSYVTEAGGAYIAGMLEIYSEGYTQAVTTDGFTTSGRGIWSLDGENITLNKSSGIAYDGVAKFLTLETGEKAIVLSNGITYVQDDNSSYIKNLTVTPKFGNTSSSTENEETTAQDNSYSNELTYEGSASDPQSGITQYYTLKIKSDFSAASIGGGPYTIIEDQGDGSYMWLDGTIIGMSFRPSKNSCAVFGSDGSYFCTLYRQ